MAGKAGSLRMPLAAGAAVLAGLILGVAVYLMLPTRSPESNLPRTPVPHPAITPSLPPPPASPAKPSPKPVAPPGDKTPAPPTVDEPMPNIMTLEPTGEPSPGARRPGHGKTPGGTPKAKPGADTSGQVIEPAPVRRLELWSAIRQGMISLELTVHPDPDNPKVMKDVEIKMKREVLVPLIVEIKKGVKAFAASTPGSIGVRVAADTEVDLQGEPEVTLTLPVAGKPSVRFLKIGPHKKPASPEGKGP